MPKNEVSLDSRESLLRAIPCFAKLSTKESRALASLLQEIVVLQGETIVKQHDLIDAIYIIVSGEALVTHEDKHISRKHPVPIATLSVGEAVGLSVTGFYSTTGKRTATVTAVTPMILLRLDVKNLYLFLQKHHLELSMSAASLQMLRMRLIKQSLPFSKLSHERLLWLAGHVEELSIPANSIIFRQGDKGDKCYLIRSGEVEILREDEHGIRTIASLRPPTLFGEATLITHSVRNATAKTKTDCELLVLSYDHLAELLESEDNVAHTFMTLMVDRSMPLRQEHVSVHERTTADGQQVTILKNENNGRYFKLSEEGAFIWEQLNGERTLQDITLNLAEEKKVFAPDMVAALISKLTKSGYISNVSLDDYHANQPWWSKRLARLKKIVKVRFAFGDADPWISKTYQRFVRFLFTPIALLILSIIILSGLGTFIVMTRPMLDFFSLKHMNLLLLIALIPFSMLVAVLHELGHAFAVKACEREVHYIGVGWDWIIPIAFTDTSDMWLATRKRRMFVNLAGVFVDVTMAGLASLLIICFSNPYLQGLLWLFALYSYLRAVRMLSPLQEMDGYYVLMDWLEKTRLKQSAVLWLVKVFPKCFVHPSLCRGYGPEKSYWLFCLLYLIVITWLTFLVQNFVLDALNIVTINRYLMLMLPFCVAVFSSIGIFAAIKNQRED